MKEVLYFGINEQAQLMDGSEVWTQLILPEWENVILTETEEHETLHAVVGEKVHHGSVKEVSTIPGPGYLGYTQMNFMTAEAAIAPDALRMRGTGEDRRIVSQMRVSEGAAATVAKNIVRNSPDEIKSVGFELQKKRILSGTEVRVAMARVHEGAEMEVFRLMPDGKTTSSQQKAGEQVVFDLYLPTDIPLAA